jgi:50S ribosomal subunit-associated GTPase HflX
MDETDEKEKINETVKKSMKLVKPPRNMKAGLIGLTNIGKTSIFNLLTNSNGPVDESCFCTIGIDLTVLE